jgi:hypothetical protein
MFWEESELDNVMNYRAHVDLILGNPASLEPDGAYVGKVETGYVNSLIFEEVHGQCHTAAAALYPITRSSEV